MRNASSSPKGGVAPNSAYWLGVACFWTLAVCALCLYAIFQSRQGIADSAILEARTIIDKDLAFRTWIAEQGGVYVPLTAKTPPNPHLKLPNRDVITTGGTKLTLLNPDYVIRLVHQNASRNNGVRGHLTSLKPVRPENRPDPWEEDALERIAKGGTEVTAFAVGNDGKRYLRQMRALTTGTSCLACHAREGYSPGDVHGGLSVSVPLQRYYALYEKDRNGTLIRYSIVWGLGICGILLLRSSLKRSSASVRASEERFRALIEQAPEAIVVFDPDAGRIVDTNPAAQRLFGCGRDELLKGGPQRFYPVEQPDGRPVEASMHDHVRRVLCGELVQTERAIRTADGRDLLCELILTLLPSEGGNLIRASYLDVTDRKQAEYALANSNKFNQQIINCSHEGIVVLGTDLRYQVWNPFMEEMTGFARDEVIGRHPLELFPQLEGSCVLEGLEKALEGEIAEEIQAPILGRGKSGWNIYSWVPLRDETGGIIGVIGTVRDVTESRKVEQALKEKEYFFRESQRAAMVGSYKVDFATGVWESSEVLESIFGIERGDPKYIRDWLEIVHPEDRETMARYLEESVIGRRQPFDRDYRIVRRSDGEQRWVLGLGQLSFGPDGEPTAMSGTIQDITERKRAEQKLRQSHDLMSYIIRHDTSALAVHDKELRYLFVSERYLDDYKVQDRDVIGRHHYDVFPDLPRKWRDVHQKALEGIASSAEIDRYDKEDGSVEWTSWECRPWYEADGGVGGFVVYSQVITDRIKAEQQRLLLQQQLNQAQKMESIGRLAGGVAHDFNNMLGVILGRADLALLRMEPGHPVRADLEEIKSSAERSADLTRQLLAFARQQTVSPKAVDLNEAVSGMLKMLQRLIGEGISINWHPAPDLWQVRIDTSQLDQILANLCVNARDAIRDVGKIVIETRNVSFDAGQVGGDSEHVSGDYVQLTFGDNGCGMSREVMDNIFEPFYTTKELGKGTGLGLATVYGAVKQNGGFIDVSSAIGTGTTFWIHLPRSVASAAEESVGISAPLLPKGHETILLVEDEPAILKMTRSMLELGGYRVLEAATPAEAVRLAGEHEGGIDLLMTDVVMPEMNGKELAGKILALYPGLKRLFMSGYTAEVIAPHGMLDEGVHFIQKPFNMAVLSAKLREVLNG